MALILQAFGTLVLLYLSTFVFCLVRNVNHARQMGLPVVTIPIDQNHFIWMLTSVPLRPRLQRILPSSIWRRLTLTIYGWEFHEKLRPFLEYAAPQGNDKTFILAGCGRLELWTRDAEIATEILRRPRDFHTHQLTDLFMAIFGHNVLTSNGDSWARQRKLIASVINERISKTVFEEGVRQTLGMLDELHESDPKSQHVESNQLFDMLKKITIHVLGGAGMGASVSWKNAESTPPPGFKMTYIDAVQAVMNAITGPILLPVGLLLRWPAWLPGHDKMKQLGHAKLEFPKLTNVMLDNERKRLDEAGMTDRSNIMSQLLQASEEGSMTGSGKSNEALSDDEMMGNLFIFSAAGFETTANTLSYALMLLARFPSWQDWLVEEARRIIPDDGDEDAWDYATVYPKATRVLAFMLETMRLYTPVSHVTKQTVSPQIITTSRGTISVPANTSIYINATALHIDPEVWRDINRESDPTFVNAISAEQDDEYVFRPSRWLNPPGSAQPIFQPPRGSFIPWSMGPRVCPGQKMAQVEFTAVILTLLRKHGVEAVPLGDENKAQVEQRLEARMRDSMNIVTLQMNGVYGVGKDDGVAMRLSRG